MNKANKYLGILTMDRICWRIRNVIIKLTEIATNVDIFYGANYVLVCKFFNQFQSC